MSIGQLKIQKSPSDFLESVGSLLKAREQPNPNTHATRDSKGKFVIG